MTGTVSLTGFKENPGNGSKVENVNATGHAMWVTNKGAAPNTLVTLLDATVTTGAGDAVANVSAPKTYQVSGLTSAGVGSAIVVVEGSNDNNSWNTIGTVTLTLGTSITSDSFLSNDRFVYVRGNVTTLTGTDATVSLTRGA